MGLVSRAESLGAGMHVRGSEIAGPTYYLSVTSVSSKQISFRSTVSKDEADLSPNLTASTC